jgi:glyoxylase-like metal-dependent hydrolase (beta-lactamase superfamily II)
VRGEVSPQADRLLQGGEVISLSEDLRFEVLHTPGHTPGSICLLVDGYVFTGDTLLAGGFGRTDLEESSPGDVKTSVEKKLFPLDERVIILPGHGPASTIGAEKKVYSSLARI